MHLNFTLTQGEEGESFIYSWEESNKTHNNLFLPTKQIMGNKLRMRNRISEFRKI